MSGIYLDGKMAPSLLDVCRRANPAATGWSGWATRARSSGGFPGSGPMGLVVHHTASPARSTPGQQFNNDASYCAVGHTDAPVGNIVLGPDGEVSCHAAGAANTQGKGGPWTTSRGVVPLDGGNSRLIAVEASNDGQGQVWSPAQCEVYAALAVEMAGAYGFRLDRWSTYSSDILSHEEWTKPSCPGRKCDPAGPSPWSPKQSGGCSAGNLWSMDLFRAALGQPGPTPTPSGDLMLNLITVNGAGAKFVGMIDSKGLGHTVSWVRTQAELDTYARLGAVQRTLNIDELAGLWLVGPVPTGDHAHNWTGSEFHPV